MDFIISFRKNLRIIEFREFTKTLCDLYIFQLRILLPTVITDYVNDYVA
jgi:hypothetical protein